MFELLGLLGGAVTRLFPTVMDYFQEGRNLKYELLRMDKQAELEKTRADNRLGEIAAINAAQIDGAWASSLVEAVKNATPPVVTDAGKWYLNVLNAANVSVRPVLTYWWCIVLYTFNKGVFLWVGVTENLPTRDLASLILTDFDRAVVGSIIGFWFVDRALRGQAK